MISEQLQKKIDFAIKLLRSIPLKEGESAEISFSGGKDSSVILQLAKMAGIKFTPIYKNTTIDPKGNVAFCKSQGCEVVMPKRSFLKIIEAKGFPSRFARFCCSELKEYKIKEHAVIGVRKDESGARDKRYQEPQQCRAYGNGGKAKKDRSNVCQHYYPILTWNNQDVADFLLHYNVDINPHYLDDDGNFDPNIRLGCICCPLASREKRLIEFQKHPNMVKAYIRAGSKWWNKERQKPLKTTEWAKDIYEVFFYSVFCDTINDFNKKTGRNGLFPQMDCKKFLEDYFNVKLD